MRYLLLVLLLLQTSSALASAPSHLSSRDRASPLITQTDCEQETLWTCVVRINDGSTHKQSVYACSSEEARKEVQGRFEGVGIVESCGAFNP